MPFSGIILNLNDSDRKSLLLALNKAYRYTYLPEERSRIGMLIDRVSEQILAN